MAIIDSTLDLQSFYPPDLKILCVEDTDDKSDWPYRSDRIGNT